MAFSFVFLSPFSVAKNFIQERKKTVIQYTPRQKETQHNKRKIHKRKILYYKTEKPSDPYSFSTCSFNSLSARVKMLFIVTLIQCFLCEYKTKVLASKQWWGHHSYWFSSLYLHFYQFTNQVETQPHEFSYYLSRSC